MGKKDPRLSIEKLLGWCGRTEQEIEKSEKEYREKLLRDIKEALERGAIKPSPCKKSWRGRFGT